MRRSADNFAEMIKQGIERLFPSSRINVKVDDGIGEGHIFISFTLWTKYPNNIHQNDPAHTTMWIWNSHFEDGTLREDMKLEMSQGNRLWGYNASTLEKRIGFRGVKSGNIKKVLRAITNYFKKLKIATETHKEELQSSWDTYVSTGSIKVASKGEIKMRRTATEIIHDLQSRVASLEKSAMARGYMIKPQLRKALRNKDYRSVHWQLLNLHDDINPSYYKKGNDPQRDEMSQLITDTISALKLFVEMKTKTEKQIKDLKSNLSHFQEIADGVLREFEEDWVDPSPHGLR